MPAVKVLHLVGSPECDHSYQVSFLFAGACQSNGEFEFHYAVIDLDQMWTFTPNLKSIEDGATTENITMDLSKAIQHISTVVQPDVVIHHMYCYSGSVYFRSLMEMLDIPLIGSSSQTVSITKNKALTRGALTNTKGVTLPQGVYLNTRLIAANGQAYRFEEIRAQVGFPCVVKAACIEDSLGVFLVKSELELNEAIAKAFILDDDVVIEEFIPGDEIRCGVIEMEDGTLEVLPMFKYDVDIHDIRPTNAKLVQDQKGRPVKPQTGPQVLKSTDEGMRKGWWENISRGALQAFRVLKLRDFGLFDFRVHEVSGEAYLLEVSLFCSFGFESVVNSMARAQGYTDDYLLQMVIRKALTRKETQNRLMNAPS